MPLEEAGSSKDVPPLRRRGLLALSTFVQNWAVKTCTSIRKIVYGWNEVKLINLQEVPD